MSGLAPVAEVAIILAVTAGLVVASASVGWALHQLLQWDRERERMGD